MKEETRKRILEQIDLLLHPYVGGTPTHNEFGHPFDKEKDPLRGPPTTTITIDKTGVVITVKRAKYSPITHSLDESLYTHTIFWGD